MHYSEKVTFQKSPNNWLFLMIQHKIQIGKVGLLISTT